MIRTFALLLSEGSISTNMKIVSSAARGSCFVGVVRKNRKWRIYRENQHSTSLNPHPGGSFTLCHYVQYIFFSSLTAFGAVKHLLYIYSHLWRNRRLWWRVKNLMVFFYLEIKSGKLEKTSGNIVRHWNEAKENELRKKNLGANLCRQFINYGFGGVVMVIWKFLFFLCLGLFCGEANFALPEGPLQFSSRSSTAWRNNRRCIAKLVRAPK